MKINPNGSWTTCNASEYLVDSNLAQGLVRFLLNKNAKSIIDLGAGSGYYSKVIKEFNIKVHAYDGNIYAPEISDGLVQVKDLSIKQNLPKVDWILSLEVAEHIPKECENIFLFNVTNSAKEGLILSWAIPEHGGDGHINPRDNVYVIEKLRKLNFIFDKESTDYLRMFPNPYPLNCWWFSKTILVFERI